MGVPGAHKHVGVAARFPPGSHPGSGVLRSSLALTCSAGAGHGTGQPEPPPPDGADGRLTQLGTGPVMMPPAPSAGPWPGLPLKARIIVSPAGMPPLPSVTDTERWPLLVTPLPTDTLGCGAGW